MNIDHVAKLARLELSEEERAEYGKQLETILAHFEAIQKVDVSGIEPTAHAFTVENVWRVGDEPGPVYTPDVLERIAPASRDQQVVVPKVVE